MEKRLEGTVALVTGASSGIGEATALMLAAEGASVAIVARRRDRLETLAERIRAEGGSALVIEGDLIDEEQAKDAVERTVSKLGRLDTLVNNAGVMLLGPAVGAPLDEWTRMVEINVLGLLYCSHAALPHLLSAAEDSPRKVSDMVNISSVAGRVARSGSAVYNTTKFGVVAFSEGLRQEVTGKHLRVSIVEPGASPAVGARSTTPPSSAWWRSARASARRSPANTCGSRPSSRARSPRSSPGITGPRSGRACSSVSGAPPGWRPRTSPTPSPTS